MTDRASTDSLSHKTSLFSSLKSKVGDFAKKAAEKTLEFREVAKEKSLEWTERAKEAASKLKKEPGSLEKQSIFGMALDDCVSLSSHAETKGLPAIVYRCIQYLDMHGRQEIGIYRVSGSSSAIQKLRKAFEDGSDVDLRERGVDVNTVASVLKSYLRECKSFQKQTRSQHAVPDRILSPELESQMIDLIDAQGSPTTENPADHPLFSSLAQTCLLLPKNNYLVLQALFKHLHAISLLEHVNKMSVNNLQLIFEPSLEIPGHLLGLFIAFAPQIFASTALPKNAQSREMGSLGRSNTLSESLPRQYIVASDPKSASLDRNMRPRQIDVPQNTHASPGTGVPPPKPIRTKANPSS